MSGCVLGHLAGTAGRACLAGHCLGIGGHLEEALGHLSTWRCAGAQVHQIYQEHILQNKNNRSQRGGGDNKLVANSRGVASRRAVKLVHKGYRFTDVELRGMQREVGTPETTLTSPYPPTCQCA